MKTFDNLSDMFSNIAHRKQRAAKARFAGSPANAEHSSEVYARSCARIAASLAEDGFRFAKSGPHLTKKRSEFNFKISFRTSHNNIPGEHVALWIAASVCCSGLKRWREQQIKPYRTDDWLAGGVVHLLTGHKWLEWELADPGTRDQTIQEVVSFLRKAILPYFHRFPDPDYVVLRLVEEEVPGLSIGSQVEFALWRGERNIAVRVLRQFLTHHPDLQAQILQEISNFRSKGFPNHPDSRYAQQIAWLSCAYDLEI
jgi:hypothetical protein